MSDQQQTLSVPSLLLLAAFAAITVRYFFFTKPSSSSSTSSSNASSTRPNPRAVVDPAHIEQIATMFPQIGRRDIMWDLQRNGGSVTATTERILARGSLDTPPPSFQPLIPAGATPSTAHTTTTPAQTKSQHIDLIKRYNLQSRISSSSTPSRKGKEKEVEEEESGASVGQTQSWSNNKNERQALLRRRREDMILNARRKLEEKERMMR